ncbi:MAG: hypothetical protein R2788_15265 [Saprospiraceae bacterium]
MKSNKAKGFLKALIPFSFLTLSLLCNALTYQDSFASHETTFISCDENLSSNWQHAPIISGKNPFNRLLDFYLLGIEEVNNLEESNEDSKDGSSFTDAIFALRLSETVSAKNAPFAVTSCVSCQLVKKFILFHSFKIDC